MTVILKDLELNCTLAKTCFIFSVSETCTQLKKNEFITFNLFKGCFAFGIIDVRFEAILTATVFNPPPPPSTP